MNDDLDRVLDRAMHHARRWRESLQTRPVPARISIDDVHAALGGPLPEQSSDPAEVIDLLAEGVEPGLVAIGSGRFFGFVMGGALPVALGADWLTSAWDQNSGLRAVTPGTVGVEEIAGRWLLDLLGLPESAAVGFTTGATMANWSGLAAARHAVLSRAGWDLAQQGLFGAPRVRVLVGAERHDTIDLALRYLGLGTPDPVSADAQGRMRMDALAQALDAAAGQPTVVVLQAGNVHSGASDPFDAAIDLAHQHGAWVHVDGAFGLWAAASPQLRHLVAGVEGADSWGTDAHKTLNVPYDCGVVVIKDANASRAALGMHGDYLVQSTTGLDPLDVVPELSRRAHGIPTWAVLRTLGRGGVADLVEGMAAAAAAIAAGLDAMPGVEVLHDVVFTQVTFSVGDEQRRDEVVRRLQQDGTTWISGSRWHDRPVLRVSVSNYSTGPTEVQVALTAVRRALG